MTILAFVLLALAIIQLVVGGLAWTGKLPGNNIIGIRIPEARSSEEMWVLTHKIAGPLWIAAGVALLFSGLLAFNVSGLGWALVMIGVLAWLILVGMGAGMAANAVALIDASKKNTDDHSTDTPGAAPTSPENTMTTETTDSSAPHTTAPAVDNAALLAAAGKLSFATATGVASAADTSGGACTAEGCEPATAPASAPAANSNTNDQSDAARTDASCADASCTDSSCEDEDPSKDCGVSGGCGSCALNGACEGGDAAYNSSVDMAALQRAAEKQT